MSELVCRTLELLAESKGTFASAVKNIFNTRTMAILKISDLPVGDWVMVEWPDGERWRGRLTRLSVTGGVEVCCANDKHVRCSSDFISSIPITAEILEKNGFEENCERWYNSNLLMEFEQYKDGWCRTINDGEYSVYFIKYVHQLQHVLRLAGVEKEINL